MPQFILAFNGCPAVENTHLPRLKILCSLLTNAKLFRKIKNVLIKFNIGGEINCQFLPLVAIFLEKKVFYSALFTNLVGWHAGTVSFPLSYIILVQLDCPLSDIMFC